MGKEEVIIVAELAELGKKKKKKLNLDGRMEVMKLEKEKSPMPLSSVFPTRY